MAAEALQRETATFLKRLPGWSQEHRGQFVIICDDFVSFYTTLGEALNDAYKRFDRRPFLVKEVVAPEHLERVTPRI
jgi:hypothetical protein